MEELGTLSGLHRSHISKATVAAEVQEEKVDKLAIKFLHTDGDFGNYWIFFQSSCASIIWLQFQYFLEDILHQIVFKCKPNFLLLGTETWKPSINILVTHTCEQRFEFASDCGPEFTWLRWWRNSMYDCIFTPGWIAGIYLKGKWTEQVLNTRQTRGSNQITPLKHLCPLSICSS